MYVLAFVVGINHCLPTEPCKSLFIFSKLKLISELKLPFYWTSRKLNICPSGDSSRPHIEPRCWWGVGCGTVSSLPSWVPPMAVKPLSSVPTSPLQFQWLSICWDGRTSCKDSCNQKYSFGREIGVLCYHLQAYRLLSCFHLSNWKNLFLNFFLPVSLHILCLQIPFSPFHPFNMFSVLLRTQTFGKQKPMTTGCFCFSPCHRTSWGHKQLATSGREKEENGKGKNINRNI